jgi:very-short-patch-repair endonuclease
VPRSMDKKEYIIRQLGRAKNKKYEAYVVTRIIHLLNDFSIKFITQQYVTRPEGRALTDLFFPQFGLHIEVDEGQHFSQANIQEDKIREADIINATGHEILRIDVTKSFEDINKQIDVAVNKLKWLRKKRSFIPWDIESEFNSMTFIKRGYIDIVDNVAFKTIKDACNCFGHNYTGYQRAGATHPDTDVMLWFPKLFPNGEWDNQISSDEKVIIERNEDEEKAKQHVLSHISNKEKHKHQRIVFAKVRGSLGDILYRFRGQYELDVENSNEKTGLIWRRIKTRVATYETK